MMNPLLAALLGQNDASKFATPGFNPSAPNPLSGVDPSILEALQKKPESQGGKISAGVNKVDDFLNKPGGSFLMNLLAQQGFSTMPQSPFGAIGRAGIATQQQSLQKQMIEARLGVGQDKSSFGLIDRSKYTKESVKRFEDTGRQSDLVLRDVKKVSSDQSRFEFFETLDPEQQRAFTQLQRAAPRPVSVPGGGFGTVDPVDQEFDVVVPEETIQAGIAGRAGAGEAGKQGVLSTAERAVDTAYGPTFVEWTTNGSADALKGLSQLKEARASFDTDNVSGPVIGLLPDFVLARTNPLAADTKAKIEEVVQRNLRLVLGAQFTENEGIRLIKRAFDPSLEEGLNAKRLDRLMQQMQLAVDAKNDQAAYFQENGTLKGWDGKLPTLDDFDRALDDKDGKVRKVYNPQTGKIDTITAE